MQAGGQGIMAQLSLAELGMRIPAVPSGLWDAGRKQGRRCSGIGITFPELGIGLEMSPKCSWEWGRAPVRTCAECTILMGCQGPPWGIGSRRV